MGFKDQSKEQNEQVLCGHEHFPPIRRCKKSAAAPKNEEGAATAEMWDSPYFLLKS